MKKPLEIGIASAMGAITKLPADEVPGPQPGRVEFAFTKSETETLFLNVSIASIKNWRARNIRSDIIQEFFNNKSIGSLHI